MLVNLKEMLTAAENSNSAVGSYNIYNLESILAVKEAAEKMNAPAIISFGESYMNHAPIEAIASIVKTLFAASDIPITLHLDHCKNFSSIAKAAKAGFTSVMYDGSRLPLEENIRSTQKVIELARALNISVEGELGYMNEEDGTGRQSALCTDEKDAAAYAAQTGIDALAIAIGNAHGIYKSAPKLNFSQLDKIRENVKCPLVLHGSSGIPFTDLKKAIDHGIRKFNVNTEISTAGVASVRAYLKNSPYESNPNLRLETVLKKARADMSGKITEFMKLFANKD